MRIPTRRTRRILTRMLCPRDQHLRPTLRDIVIAKVPCVDTTSVDEQLTRRRRGV